MRTAIRAEVKVRADRSTTCQDLDLLRSYVEHLTLDSQNCQANGVSSLTIEAIKRCKVYMHKLEDLMKPLVVCDTTGKRERAWKAVKGGIRASRIDRMRSTLESAKITILLIQQTSAR